MNLYSLKKLIFSKRKQQNIFLTAYLYLTIQFTYNF